MNLKSFWIFLSRNKAYTLINVLGLSLSLMFVILIGTYTWQEYHVNAQYPKADRILVYGINMQSNGNTLHYSGGAWGLQQHFRARYPEIESSCAIFGGKNHSEPGFTDKNGNRTQHPTLFVDSTFFSLLDIPLVLGDARTALRDPSCAVVTEEFAKQYFGSPEKAMGKRLSPDFAAALHITGVMSRIAHSSLPEADVVVRFENVKAINDNLVAEGMNNAVGAEILFLEREGTHLEDKLKDMDQYQKQFFWIFQMPGFKLETTLTPLSQYYFTKLDGAADFSQGDGKLVGVLFAVGLVILLFAIFNYVNLTNALSGRRMREMAMRRLVGATKKDVIVRIISESILLCIVSLIVAFLFAWAVVPFTEQLLSTELDFSPLRSPAGIALILSFTLLLGIVAGAMPASILSKAKPIDIVKGATPLQGTHRRLHSSAVFIVFQNTATIVLIATALAMSAQIHYMITAYRGFKTNNIIDARLSFGNAIQSSKDKSAVDAWYNGLKRLPQVVDVSACIGTPYSGGNNETFNFNGRKTISSQVIYGDSHFMKIFGLKVLSKTGLRNSHGHQVYVNRQMLAEEGLPMDSKFFYWQDNKKENLSGVIEDFTIGTFDSEQHPVRLAITDDSLRYKQWDTVIEIQGDPVEAWESIRKLFKEVFHSSFDSDHPFLDQRITDDYGSEKRITTILYLFAGIAVVISVLGLIAISTFYINNRRKEMAVRKVFGATSGQVGRRFIGHFLSYVLVAFVIAAPVTVYLYGGWVAQFSRRAVWWPWIVVAGFAVVIVSFLAVALQTWNAARQNPSAYLKQE